MDGKIDLHFALRNHKTIMKDVFYQPPLKASRGLYVDNPDDITVYLMESSGGLVAGDINAYRIRLDKGTNVTLHPQAATKVYPAFNGKPSKQEVYIEIAEQACLTWKREEVIPFAESEFHSHTTVNMKKGSSFYWEEILYPGREKRGERFTFNKCHTQLEVWMEEDCLVYDGLRFEPSVQNVKHFGVMGDYHYIASVWIIDSEIVLDVEKWSRSSTDHQVSITKLRDAGYLVRFLSNDLPRVKKEMDQLGNKKLAVSV
ncbi:urease accessory protein UreD [Gracilibacillus saliphilus]|uniref:urease accessory protein UreD n=1 Tax=Gracilibacillus saliphilus TaxID=543890 RepID=UPI0013D6063E|nr:urease accessory protein UreD [Gracilibacillus saliphilus]